MLCHPQFPVPLVTKLEARVVVLDVAIPLLQGQQVISISFNPSFSPTVTVWRVLQTS